MTLLSLVFPKLSVLRLWLLPREEPGSPLSLGLLAVWTLLATPSLAAFAQLWLCHPSPVSSPLLSLECRPSALHPYALPRSSYLLSWLLASSSKRPLSDWYF